jgi:hypothetical protein
MHELLTIDLGPDFSGFHGQIAGTIVCVATPRVEHDAQARREVRDLIKRQGGDCAACRNCIIGRHQQ